MRIREIAWFVSTALLLLGPGAAEASSKTTLCHVDPKAPESPYEIVVGDYALQNHLKYHPSDRVGTCETRCKDASACDDANACTKDVCNADGTCDNTQPVDCGDGNDCTIDACDPKVGCVNPPVPDADELACDDGDACSAGDLCIAGACSGTPTEGCCLSDADCPASDDCAVSYCDDSTRACTSVDLSGQCGAGACEVAFCDPAGGCGTAPVTCPDDGDICTIATCNPDICGESGACETLPNPNPPEAGLEVSCDDGLDNDCDDLVDANDPDCDDGCDETASLTIAGIEFAGSGDPSAAATVCGNEIEFGGIEALPDDEFNACIDFIVSGCSLLSGIPSCVLCIVQSFQCDLCQDSLQAAQDFYGCPIEVEFGTCEAP
jgi:hypothetical protein